MKKLLVVFILFAVVIVMRTCHNRLIHHYHVDVITLPYLACFRLFCSYHLKWSAINKFSGKQRRPHGGQGLVLFIQGAGIDRAGP
jgi:hypothetical protein